MSERWDDELLDYLSGRMDDESVLGFEDRLRSDEALRNRFLEAQEQMEHSLSGLHSGPVPRRLKRGVDRQIRKMARIEREDGWNVWFMRAAMGGGWAAAAMLAVLWIVRPMDNPSGRVGGEALALSEGLEPTVVVFRLDSDTRDPSAGKIEQVLYQKHPAGALITAERMAESLWHKGLRSDSSSRHGFMVLDVQGRQGFVSLPISVEGTRRQVWMAHSDTRGDGVLVGEFPQYGDLEENEGVFFFHLSEDSDSGSSVLHWKPVVKDWGD